MVGVAARAEECDARRLETTAARTECARRNADAALAEMNTGLERAVEVARALAGSGAADFEPEIRETQQDWQRWVVGQCRLEGGVQYGSSGGIAEAGCIERLAGERTRSLNGIAEKIRGVVPSGGGK
jgi:hypothetical protein